MNLALRITELIVGMNMKKTNSAVLCRCNWDVENVLKMCGRDNTNTSHV